MEGNTHTDSRRVLTRNEAVRRGLKDAYCERCGYKPQNRSQAIRHAAECGSIVAPAKAKEHSHAGS